MLENFIVASISLVCGLLIGTVFSLFFYNFSSNNMGISNLETTINIAAYKATSSFFVIVYLVTIIGISIRTSRLNIKQLLYDERQVKIGHSSSALGLIIGTIMLIITTGYLVTFFNQNDSNVLMICFVISVIGIFIIISNSLYGINLIKKKNRKAYYRDMMYLSGIEYKFANNKKIFFFTVCLMGIVVFFQIFAFTTAKTDERNVETYYPYHIAYMEYDEEDYPTSGEINDISEKENIAILKSVELKYYVTSDYSLFSSDDIERISGENYRIKQGECVVYSQYDTKDGYPHYDKPTSTYVKIQGGDFSKKYLVKNVCNEVLINEMTLETDYCAVLNAEDFKTLVKHENTLDTGAVRVIQCKSIGQSKKLCETIKTLFCGDKSNNMDFSEISAKYKAIEKDEQTANFLIFVLTIMDILLFISNVMMIHFKLLSGIGLDKKRYNTMFEIGFSFKTIYDIVKKDIRTITVLPAFLAFLFGGLYAYSLLRLSGTIRYILFFTLLVGVIVIIFQCVIAQIYAKYYMHKIFRRDGGIYK